MPVNTTAGCQLRAYSGWRHSTLTHPAAKRTAPGGPGLESGRRDRERLPCRTHGRAVALAVSRAKNRRPASGWWRARCQIDGQRKAIRQE